MYKSLWCVQNLDVGLFTLADGSLTLRDVQLRQSGVYQCFAENVFGSVHSFARLIVQSKMEKMEAEAGHQNEMQNVAPSGAFQSHPLAEWLS